MPRHDKSAEWLRTLASRHRSDDVYLAVGPPRAATTAFSRVLWNCPQIRYYSHEPFESRYFGASNGVPVDVALQNPLDLAGPVGSPTGAGFFIKEISFQIGEDLVQLASLSSWPVCFLIRDPRLSIASRREVRRRQGVNQDFPVRESGWDDLLAQVQACRSSGREYFVVDSADFRAAPATYFRLVYERWGLSFSESQLSWQPVPELVLSNHRTSGGDPFFTRVLNSAGIQPSVETPPDMSDFSAELRDHAEHALAAYRALLADPLRVRAS